MKKQILILNLFYITNCKFCSLNCLVGGEIVFLIIKHKFSHFNSDLVIKRTECHCSLSCVSFLFVGVSVLIS
jgi:hypothetical protein